MTQTTELMAGREMDALVAEKVMGWREVARVGQRDTFRVVGIAPRSGDREAVPYYSADIAAAWQVAENLSCWSFRLERAVDHQTGTWGGFVVVIKGQRVDAETAPLAICRAALAAVEA